jgi:hypothetical protein
LEKLQRPVRPQAAACRPTSEVIEALSYCRRSVHDGVGASSCDGVGLHLGVVDTELLHRVLPLHGDMLITYDHDSSAERPDSRREEEQSSPRDLKVHTVEALFSPTTSSHRLCPSPPWSTPWFCPSSIRFAAAATATSLTFLVRRLLFREDGIERKSTGFDMMVGIGG